MTPDSTPQAATVAAESSPSFLHILIAMFTEPGRAFAAVARRGAGWFPLLLLTLSACVLLYWYYQTVDFSWLVDKMTASVADPAVREKAKQFMSKNTMMYGGIGGVVLGVPVMYALLAGYFVIVSKIMKIEVKFGQWFSFVAWASLPGLLALPLGGMQILLAQHGQLMPAQINPVSLNSLLFHIEAGQRWASMLDSIGLTNFWSWILMVIGFQLWSKASRATSVMIVLLPYGVIYGIWSIKSLMG